MFRPFKITFHLLLMQEGWDGTELRVQTLELDGILFLFFYFSSSLCSYGLPLKAIHSSLSLSLSLPHLPSSTFSSSKEDSKRDNHWRRMGRTQLFPLFILLHSITFSYQYSVSVLIFGHDFESARESIQVCISSLFFIYSILILSRDLSLTNSEVFQSQLEIRHSTLTWFMQDTPIRG